MTDAADSDRTGPGAFADRRPVWGIQTRLIVYFVALFVMTLIAIGVVTAVGIPGTSYRGWHGRQRTDVFRELSLVADMKKERIERMLRERSDDLRALSHNLFVTLGVARLRERVRQLEAHGLRDADLWNAIREDPNHKLLTQTLKTIDRTYGVYQGIFIADADDGRILVAATDAMVGMNGGRFGFHNQASRTGRPHISDVNICPITGLPAIHVSDVVHVADVETLRIDEGRVAAMLVMELNPADILDPILDAGERFGRTGEALIVNQDCRIVTALRHPLPDGTRPKPLEFTNPSEPARLAAAGREGVIEAPDYRNVPVLAAYRHIRLVPDPGWGWGLVVKRDRSELHAPLLAELRWALAIQLIALFGLIGVTVGIARGITRPIVALRATAERVAAGNLGVRADVARADDIGFLAATFNGMIRRIEARQHELEEQVAVRTAELARTNANLRAEIDDRARIEDALRESQRMLQLVLDTVPTRVFWKDRESVYLGCNRTAARDAGLQSPDEIVGRTDFDLAWRASADRYRNDDRLVIETNEARLHYEEPQVTPDGQVRWLRTSKVPLRDRAGNVIGVLGTYEDITERKRAERELARTQGLLRASIEQSPAGILIADAPDVTIRLANPAALGIRAAANVPLTDIPASRHPENWQVFHADGTPFAPEELPLSRAVLYGEVTRNVEAVIRRPTGEDRWILANAAPVRDPEGGIVAGVVVFLDITDRKRAEEAMRESERRFRSIVQASPMGIYMYQLDPDDRLILIDANPAADRMTGWDSKPLLGKPIEEAFPGLAATEIPARYRSAARDGTPWSASDFTYDYGGIRGVYDVYAFQTSPGRMAVMFMDVTERKRAEQERERLNESLEEKNKELESLVYATSHDLRSPLVNIHGFSKELERSIETLRTILGRESPATPRSAELDRILNDDIPEALRYVQAGAAKMDGLLGGLLRLFRLGRAAIAPERLDMNALVPEVIRAMEFQIQAAGAAVQVDPLPACRGTPDQINQVFSNLLDNALKYLDPGRAGVIRISGYREGDLAVYCVEDNGIGIAPEHHRKVFELFHRLNAKDRPGEGLGLAIARRIVIRHNGRIWLESEPGKGSRFFVSLPADEA